MCRICLCKPNHVLHSATYGHVSLKHCGLSMASRHETVVSKVPVTSLACLGVPKRPAEVDPGLPCIPFSTVPPLQAVSA